MVSRISSGAAILLVAVGLAVAISSISVFSITSQLCTTGADEVRVQSNVLEFDGDDAWFIDASAGCDNAIFGGGGTIQAEDVQADEAAAERDFTLGLTEFEAWFYQRIQDDRSPVYNVQMKEISCGYLGCGTQAHDECDNFQAQTPSDGGAETRVDDSNTMYCFRTVRAGDVADLSLAQGSDFRGVMAAEAAGARDSDTISKDNAVASVNVGDVNGDFDAEQARITWTGSLIGEVRSMDLSGFHVTCDNDCEQPVEDVGWTVGDKDFYNQWFQYDQTGFEDCVNDALANDFDPQSCVDAYDTRASNVFSDASGAIESQAGFDVAEVRTRGDELQVVAERGAAVERPDFRILVDADWIGFDIPVAAPNIQPTESVTVVGNSQTTAVVDVRNDASVGGEIQVSADCPSPVTGGSDTQFVAAGDTKQFTIDVASGPAEDQSVVCELTAQDTDDASTADSAGLKVDVEASCEDADGDGVCDKFDACPDTPGPSNNNGCPVTDDDDTTESGGGFFHGLADTLRGTLGGVGDTLADGAEAVGDAVAIARDGVDAFVEFLRNPLGNLNTAINAAVVVSVFVAAFQVTRTSVVEPFIGNVAAVTRLNEAMVRFLVGVLFGLMSAWVAYSLIAGFWAKIVLIALIAAGLYVYVTLTAPL